MRIIKKNIVLFFSLLIFVLISGCTPQQQTTNQTEEIPKEKEIYVFDDVSAYDSTNVEPQVNTPDFLYLVQVGAFTTQGRADTFVKENQAAIPWKLNITFSNRVNLYVVQLPAFNTRLEAEDVRNQLWQIGSFKDAFILTVEK
ncbi:MAG: SPOR domain-containing protein [bacterium]